MSAAMAENGLVTSASDIMRFFIGFPAVSFGRLNM
jgi:hypothetical protein